MKIFGIICALLFATLFSLTTRADYGLPATMSAYGGAFGTLDQGTASACGNANNLTSNCSCPGGTTPAFQVRVIKDSELGTWGGYSAFCSSGSFDKGSEFKGGYQLDDSVNGGQGCRVGNINTGSCTCPYGTVTQPMRVLTDSGAGIIGSSEVICTTVASNPVSFAGAFQQDDPVYGSAGCRVGNPYTNSCSCPAGFEAQPQRVLVDSYAGFIGSHIYTCAAPPVSVQLCPSIYSSAWADPAGRTDASGAIQGCIDHANQSILELPAGTFQVTSQINVNISIIIRTVGTGNVTQPCTGSVPCFTIQAAPTFHESKGLLALTATGATLDHIVLDGNRAMRIGSDAWNDCYGGTTGSNVFGFNASAQSCSSCGFENSASIAALCGTGFEWDSNSDHATITNSIFAGNGQHDHNLWSDGLTVHKSSGATITGNRFVDNSDVGLILGGGTGMTIANNYFSQYSMRAFAAFMMDNFNNTTSGDFTGSTISNNSIYCGQCLYGMNIGPHAWYLSNNIQGGSTAKIVSNNVQGADIGINVDGASDVLVQSNTIGNASSTAWIRCDVAGNYIFINKRFNLAPDSSLVSGSDTPNSTQYTHNCH